MRVLVNIFIVLCGCGCATRPELVVTHSPNPCDVHHAKAFRKDPFPFMWYYRTEVQNKSSRPIQITSFEGYFFVDGKWISKNVLHRKLTSQDFSKWYSEGVAVTNGWIPAGGVAVCDPNWHGSRTPTSPRCKWTFVGVDAEGRTFQAEAEIETLPIKR